LKLYKRLGLEVTAIHRVLSFTQEEWMKPYIELNTRLRQAAKSEFEKSLYKLCINGNFGKSLQNTRNYKDIHLVASPVRAKKLLAKPTLKHFHIINEKLTLFEMCKPKVKLNKPIYAGFTILDLSKELMYSFHYDVIKQKYNDNVKLLFTDTDSLCYHISTPDLYSDMVSMSKYFDTSDYPTNHALYSTVNKKVAGKMKDECNGKIVKSFVGLRAKNYSLLLENEKNKMTGKGVKRSYMNKHVTHNMFLQTLKTKTVTHAEFRNFQSRHHTLYTVEVNKVCLSAYDDKRCILDDGVHTLAYGHYSIQERV